MKTYGHVLDFICTEKWAIEESKLRAIVAILESRYMSLDGLAYEARAETPQPRIEGNQVAVLPLFGTIARRANVITEASGGASIEGFTRQFREAMADPQIGSILINIDSPGGGVYGLSELSDEIYRARKSPKRVVAIANALAASAAYWIGSSAGEFYVTPSGEVGSIGVFAVHLDRSENNAKYGFRPTYISAGKFKTETNPDAPLTDEARAHLQEGVDRYHAMFLASVARGRGIDKATVEENFGQGRIVGAKDAAKRGMVDGVMTFENIVDNMVTDTAKRKHVRATVEQQIIAANREYIDRQVASYMVQYNGVESVKVELPKLEPVSDDERAARLQRLEAELSEL